MAFHDTHQKHVIKKQVRENTTSHHLDKKSEVLIFADHKNCLLLLLIVNYDKKDKFLCMKKSLLESACLGETSKCSHKKSRNFFDSVRKDLFLINIYDI